ncbi:MAG: hypothetical protein ACR2M5_11800 [Nakamurella sp.]
MKVVSQSAAVEPDIDEPPDQDTTARPRDFVQSHERGLAIIKVFSAQRPSMTVGPGAGIGVDPGSRPPVPAYPQRSGIRRPEGQPARADPEGSRTWLLLLSALSFPDVALPHLERLVAETSKASEGSILHQARSSTSSGSPDRR